jgi:UDP-N-acetyl-D-glucosamine dehydrogenase
MNAQQQLLQKIQAKTTHIVIVGVGYVGLPLAVEFAQAGFRVTGLDVNEKKMALLNQGVSYIPDVRTEVLAPLVAEGLLAGTTDRGVLGTADAVSICVPTPLGKSKDPDISYIVDASEGVGSHAHAGMLVVLESTTYPGTTEEIILPRIAENGLQVGEDFFLAFSPERVDPANTRWQTRNTPKVLGGATPACLEVASALYGHAVDQVVPVSSTNAAEMVKLLENTFRAVNIALVNEVAIMCDKLGVDVWEVIEAAATKPFGFMPFYPGPGVGGHCIPLDPHYLSWKLKSLNYNARFIELAGEINSHMPDYVVGKVADALNDDGKPVKNSLVLVLGVAYKPDVDDVRESPALDVIHLLLEKGARVSYHDPFVPTLSQEGIALDSVDLDRALPEADCVVVVTNHRAYDWAWIASHTRLVIDTRNALREVGEGAQARIVKL